MSNALRILYVVHQYPPEHVGGTELATRTLARAQSARGHRVAVFHRVHGQPGLHEAQEEGVLNYRAQTPWRGPSRRFLTTFRHPGLTAAFSTTLDRERPDLVHIQHLMGLPLSIVAVLHRSRIPFVLTLHDYWFICPNAQLLTNYDRQVCDGPTWWVNCARCAAARAGKPWIAPVAPVLAPLFALRHGLLGRVMRGGKRIIAPSEFVTRVAVSHRVPEERVCVVHHGMDAGAVQPRASGDDEGLRFAYVGGLSWQKGVHVLIEAFNDMPAGATLEIYGDETSFPEYSRHLRAIVRSPRVTFGGRLSREGVWRTLARTDVLIVPSLWYENSPLVIQEAFAAGVPVVASAIGALSEHVRHGKDGLLVPSGDVAALRGALLRLTDDRGLLSRLREGIRPVLTIEERAERIEDIYREVLDD